MEAAVKKCLKTVVFQATGSGGGGCISKGSVYLTDNGKVFVKTNNKLGAKPMFEGEKAGLDAITATGEIRCPKALAVVTINDENPAAALVMECLDMEYSKGSTQAKLGENLAKMHLHNAKLLESPGEPNLIKPVKQFGFHVPTSCGFISQENNWHDDWATFYVKEKLQPLINILTDKKPDKQLNELWTNCKSKIFDELSQLGNIKPALLHGDLWSGNIGAVGAEPVIFDPASFYGHSEYDFGIARMFGGFTSEFFTAYHKIIPKAEGGGKRLDIYELYHHLNHWAHFGSGYKSSSLGLMRTIISN